MDPATAIGIAASVAQLADMARAIVSNMYQYFEAIKDAPIRSQELRQEMSGVCDVLDSLEELVMRSPSMVSSTLTESISGFRDMLDELTVRVTVTKTKGIRRLKWPFNKSENDRLLARISRYKETFSLALNIQQS